MEVFCRLPPTVTKKVVGVFVRFFVPLHQRMILQLERQPAKVQFIKHVVSCPN
jgi:hypothetical protein